MSSCKDDTNGRVGNPEGERKAKKSKLEGGRGGFYLISSGLQLSALGSNWGD